MTMKRTISGMIGTGSLAHNRRDFIAENVDPDRVQLNICYQNENLKDVYEGLFDEAVEWYNVGKRKDRQITNYYEKIRQGKQEKMIMCIMSDRMEKPDDLSRGRCCCRIIEQVPESVLCHGSDLC